MLAQVSDKMNEKITRTSVLSMKYSRRDGVFFVREHTEILDCMESGDLDGARTRLSAHYNSWKERMMQLPERIGFDPNEPNTKIYEEFIKIDK